MCSYALKSNTSEVYLLYPQFRYEDLDSSYPVAKIKVGGGEIHVHFVRLPFIFEDDEQHTKAQLKKTIEEILGISESNT